MFHYLRKHTLQIHIVVLEGVILNVYPDLTAYDGPVGIDPQTRTAENMRHTFCIQITHHYHIWVSAVDSDIVVRSKLHDLAPDIPPGGKEPVGPAPFRNLQGQEYDAQKEENSADPPENTADKLCLRVRWEKPQTDAEYHEKGTQDPIDDPDQEKTR